MIDSHVHIDAKAYQEFDGGVEKVLQNAANAGVERFVAPALHLESHAQLCTIEKQFPQVFPAAGVHPHESSEERSEGLREALEQRLSEARVPIVGETGLEGHYDFVPMQTQLDSLRLHLDVAKTADVPIILHCRQTEELLYQELKQYRLAAGGVIHCFTGNWEWAQKFLELGFYIGITGIVTFKKAEEVHEVAHRVPEDRLLVETDGPYLAPIPFRGKTNMPEYIPHIVNRIADIRAASPEEIGRRTALNTETLFRLPARSRSV